MQIRFLILCLLAFSLHALGQDASNSNKTPDTPYVESTWPGVQMQILEVKRIPKNRLLVVIGLWASPQAPGSTLIGIPPVIPPTATKEEIAAGFGPTSFSLEGSTMIEDLTHQKYDMVPPDPTGMVYRPSMILGSISPGQALYMTIQFPAPPPPPPDEMGHIPRQTVTILLPRAKGPITKVVVPPPTPPTPAAPGQ
jgi:hypothetical protein